MNKMSVKQIHKRYKDRYIEITETYDYINVKTVYEVIKSYKTIHENTTLGQDVGTELEYRR